MTDIVEMLRSSRARSEEGPHYLCVTAADEIERLRAALVEIYDAFDDLAKSEIDHPAVDMARAIIARASKT